MVHSTRRQWYGKKVYNQLLESLDTSSWGNDTWAESQKTKKGDTNA